ncbi:hypothetical protein F5Y15DRAFT_363736 [Xylariaceae sp. FL0016]|nr:hypothetical protein F5Y15DRAFT_363736 [Xylariaceae sp. FL0016]
MYIPRAILGLPPSLLLLLATQLRAQQQPIAIKKMSPDDGEKFLPDYYAFAPDDAPWSGREAPLVARHALLTPDEEDLLAANSSAILAFRPPLLRHYDYTHQPASKRTPGDAGEGIRFYRQARDALSRLQGRAFACPDDTHACTNIDQPNYCCTSGTECFVVSGSAESGNVGCCPEGQNCGGSVGDCSSDSTACPAAVGGGCCIPGFVCASVGCVASTVSVITQTTTSSTVLSSPTPMTSIVTVIITVTPSASTDTSTSTQTSTTQNSATSTATTTTTGGGIPPVRPTSASPSSSSSSSSTGSYCPTGFYACLASAGGGCCQTGRDCATTSCPPVESTTLVSSGETIVVPVTDATAAASTSSATCASGWFLCGEDAGPVAGCCPSGYACGTASCTLSAATATATVQKELPSGGRRAKRELGWGSLLGSVAIGLMAAL